MLADSGFERISVMPKDEDTPLVSEWAPGTDLGDYLVSANIEAVKPSATGR
jgi:hypothetical protein